METPVPEFCEISKSTYSYRTPPVDASVKGFISLTLFNWANLTNLIRKLQLCTTTEKRFIAVNEAFLILQIQ